MDVQKVTPDCIQTIKTEEDVLRWDITGCVVIPVSWLYYQAKLRNVTVNSWDKLESSLGGRVCLDVIINAKRDDFLNSFLRDVDILAMKTDDGGNEFYNFDENKVNFSVNGRKVNTLDFKHRLYNVDIDYYYLQNYGCETAIRLAGDVAHEMDFNKHALIMVKKYGINLKRNPILNDINDLLK